MKIDRDEKLFKYCVYATLTALSIYIAISIMGNIGIIIKGVTKIIGIIMALLKPLLIGLIIAYLLYPATRSIEKFLERKRFFKKSDTRRVFSIALVYIAIIGIVIAILYGIYIMIGGQVSRNTRISNILLYITDYMNNNKLSSLQDYIMSSIGNGANSIITFANNILSFFISIILSVYLIKDIEYFKELWNKIYYFIFRKSRVGKGVKECGEIVNKTFSNYIKGQLLDACIVGGLSAIALAVIGVDYAIVIGIISGICNMIPYVGPMVGTVLAAVMGLLSGEPIMVLWAVIAMLVVQQIDNNLIAPKIVGDSVGLHPVFTMIAIIIGGNIGGLLGMLVAVPLTASIKILLGKWYNQYVDYEREE